jgi:signal transduction histidine kinase
VASTLETDIATIQGIAAVPTILSAVSELTGLGFVCIARVTGSTWHSCAVLDKLNFGLRVGDSLDVTTTLCEEVRDTNAAIIIDSVKDHALYADHHTPRIYGFQSYFSIPLYRPDGAYFGTLCGLDPAPADLTRSATSNTLTLFAELISRQLLNEDVWRKTRHALASERETAELREQFIAVLGHDVRTPLGSIMNGVELLRTMNVPKAEPVFDLMNRSIGRISSLVDDLMDFTRGRMGGGISLNLRYTDNLDAVFQHVIDELLTQHPQQAIVSNIPSRLALVCDSGRLAQLLSNLLKNALLHGDGKSPVLVEASCDAEHFALSVTNSGNKIPDAVMRQLFKPFWRAKSSTPREGLGLGLFIASEIAKSHGGALVADTAEGRTTFTLTLPVAPRASGA